MKKLFVVALIAISSATFAQDSTRVANLKAKGIATYNQAWSKMDQLLNLTPEQTTEWQALNKSYAMQYKAIATNSSLTKDEKTAQAVALHTQQEADLNKILTPKQAAQWAGIKKVTKAAAQNKAEELKAAKAAHPPVQRKKG